MSRRDMSYFSKRISFYKNPILINRNTFKSRHWNKYHFYHL